MKKLRGRKRRQRILRKKIFGSKEKPRLCISKSNQNLQAQLIDDIKGQTLLALSTSNKEFKKKVSSGGNVKAAKVLGEEFARIAKEKGFGKIVFDRAGHLYHGRIKTFADSARKNGLIF